MDTDWRNHRSSWATTPETSSWFPLQSAFKDWPDLVDRVGGVGAGNAARFSQAGLTVAGKPLVLNGAGVRYKAMFKVYSAALYVPQKSQSVAEVSSTDTPEAWPGLRPSRSRGAFVGSFASADLGDTDVLTWVVKDPEAQ